MTDGARGPVVPPAWRPAVDTACADLCRRLSAPRTAVAAARVAPGSELADERVGPEVLSVWLVSGGETFGYLVDLTATPPGLTLVSAPPWLRDRA